MPLVSTAIALALFAGPDKVTYRDTKLGLQFEHPKSWKVKRQKQNTVFEIPLEGSERAVVQLFSAKYRDTAENWQLIQTEINRSLRRTIERQWQEEILGVPMLLTKISYSEKNQPTVAIVGLLYTAFEQKMNFRLTSPAANADKAEQAWREAMLTLRTTTGDLPEVNDPSKPAVKPAVPQQTKVWTAEQKTKKPVRGPVQATLSVESTNFLLYLPKGWTLTDGTLHCAKLSGTLTLTAGVALPEVAGENLVEAARKSLADFDQVTLREDPRPWVSRANAIVGTVFRTGSAKGAPLVVGTAVGSCDAVYWMVSYRSTDLKAYQADKALLKELFEFLYAEKQ